MKDIFKDMQIKTNCEYISDLPSCKKAIWKELKNQNLSQYDKKQLEDFSVYVFGLSLETLQTVIKQQKGREKRV